MWITLAWLFLYFYSYGYFDRFTSSSGLRKWWSNWSLKSSQGERTFIINNTKILYYFLYLHFCQLARKKYHVPWCFLSRPCYSCGIIWMLPISSVLFMRDYLDASYLVRIISLGFVLQIWLPPCKFPVCVCIRYCCSVSL